MVKHMADLKECERHCGYLFNQLRFHIKAVFPRTFQNSAYTRFELEEVKSYSLSVLLLRDRKDKGIVLQQKCWLHSTPCL